MGIKNGMKILENIEASGGLAAGLFLLTASAVSKGKVGAGDGLAFLVSGLFLDFWENSLLLFESLLLLSAVCLESWIFQREAAPVEHPFMPYVFLVYLGGIIWNG